MKIPLQSRRGIALIITLIFLSVIVIVAVAFLALTGRERASIADANSLADAQLMAETATERAKAEILASILAVSEVRPYGPDFLVSRSRPDTNANLTDPNIVTNLLIDPRVPVWVDTNRNGTTGPLELRDYVDINRNGKHEGTGEFAPVDDTGNPVGQGRTNSFVGDPEFIGVSKRLTDPPSPHSPANEFIGRYAHVILPTGQMPDLNYIHNYTASNPMTAQVGFARNQGVGSWEINLAEGLRAVNTNVWDPPSPPPLPPSYADATNLLSYRFNPAATAPTIRQVLGTTVAFDANGVDDFGDGPVLPFQGPGLIDGDDVMMKRWPGANNTRNFFTFHDFFAPQVAAFSGRLNGASAKVNSYDRYTFFRLLAQLGMESVPETPQAEPTRLIRFLRANPPENIPYASGGRINVNYDNYTVAPPPNLAEWNPSNFFMVSADVLLQRQFNFGVHNIQVSPTNFYNRSVHRILQMVANVYDATTTNQFPTVFWPAFTNDGPLVFISGYTTNRPAGSLIDPPDYGIPPVVGAKKGLPNFNEYSMETAITISRKLQLTRSASNSTPDFIQQMFIMGISNRFGVEAWNSYARTFSQPVQMDVTNYVEMWLVNSAGFLLRSNYQMYRTMTTNNWRGYVNDTLGKDRSNSFVISLLQDAPFLAGGVYRIIANNFEAIGPNAFEPNLTDLSLPRWQLLITNTLTFVMTLPATGQILDYVHLPRLGENLDITEEMMKPDTGNQLSQFAGSTFDEGKFWRTNLVASSNHLGGPIPEGIQQQIQTSQEGDSSGAIWTSYNLVLPLDSQQSEVSAFQGFMAGRNPPAGLKMQTPFNPARKLVFSWFWEPNDPLVHYMADDLRDRTNNMTRTPREITNKVVWANQKLPGKSRRYRPWAADNKQWLLAVQDPGVFKSDDWNFPTNKLPNIGWLGRIHRGTPWQTVYFKSEVATENDWKHQSFDPNTDQVDWLTHPTNDWALVDVFTTALHPNATRGRLSINQMNPAAWAGLLGGVATLTNLTTGNSTEVNYYPGQRTNLVPWIIDTQEPAFALLMNGIGRVRMRATNGLANTTNGVFRRLSDLLAVPELTVQSPFLGLANTVDETDPWKYGVDDMAYERIPQQVMSLLKVGEPRFVIYSFGQALKPKSIIRSSASPYFQLCTNYQVTGEFSTRAVARVEGTMVSPRIVIESYNILPTE